MNRTHRSLWNSALGAWVAAPENAHARGKRSSTARASALTAAILCAGMPAAHACTAGSTAELAACIAGADTVIDLTASITLGTQLPVVERSGTLTINGHGFTLDGAGQFRGFFIGSGTTTVNELTMRNLRAQGGRGGTDFTPGGGGMGAGGAVFVATGAGASLNDVTIVDSQAVGGIGGGQLISGFASSGGGGGMGGNGGGFVQGVDSAVGRGGGGLFDDGASARPPRVAATAGDRTPAKVELEAAVVTAATIPAAEAVEASTESVAVAGTVAWAAAEEAVAMLSMLSEAPEASAAAVGAAAV